MAPFDWVDLTSTIQDKAVGTIFWTTERIGLGFLKGLDQLNIAYLPRWSSFTECRAVFVSLGNKKHGILIKRVPENHLQLSEFCKIVIGSGRKLHYGGESAGVIAHRFMQMVMRHDRQTISEQETATLLARQENAAGATLS